MDNLTQLFVEAGTLLAAGMVFVFAFLGILVVFINLVLVKLSKVYPDPIAQPRAASISNKKTEAPDGLSSGVVAAISAAVNQYRQKHSQK
jgi:oxaloacetate decarboxylase gamma subunit